MPLTLRENLDRPLTVAELDGNFTYLSSSTNITYDPTTSGLAATNVQAAIDEVVATAPAAETTVIVTIPSSAAGTITYSDGRPNATGGILGMGVTPIILLPEVANTYYDYKIDFEYTFNSTPYVTSAWWVANSNSYSGAVINENYLNLIDRNCVWCVTSRNAIDVQATVTLSGAATIRPTYLTGGVVLTTYSGANPTTGNGTLRAIITYTSKIFGA